MKIAQADEQIAQAQLEQGARALSTGVDQLYWGLVASSRLRAGVLTAIGGAEMAAKLGSVEAKIALVEARQGLQGVESQIADLEQQLNALLEQPACTRLEVVEPPFPPPPVSCGDEAATLAVQASPEVREAEQNIVKAQAATDAAKVDYLPNVVVMGGYANQTIADYVQPNIGYVGVTANWTLFEWGKRKSVAPRPRVRGPGPRQWSFGLRAQTLRGLRTGHGDSGSPPGAHLRYPPLLPASCCNHIAKGIASRQSLLTSLHPGRGRCCSSLPKGRPRRTSPGRCIFRPGRPSFTRLASCAY